MAHTGAKSLALEKLSSKLGGKDIYEVIVSHGSRNMIKDLNEGLNKNGFMRSRERREQMVGTAWGSFSEKWHYILSCEDLGKQR